MVGPAADFVWEEVFQFSTSHGLAESVALRTVVPTDGEVHGLGCDKQARDRARDEARGRAGPTYRGCIDALVRAIRTRHTTNKHRFSVTHAPEEGDWHARITVMLAEGTAKLSKQDKQDVREIMAQVFDGGLKGHTCP
ncbi:hypothetical protein VQ03_07120 [Methylobacterium tarhaniae]|uniref:Uncharacterized protein n=1 Tax=Methylobacterium tarhaniae TaxID=1187852 RepID=A0A0J6TCW0_9HYPH|nr:hypothetical protein [Methylobacterium tarhaniae]KMO43699.1 hypothetical protein VQ03_07120 [Methylobacterium tarhaniae]